MGMFEDVHKYLGEVSPASPQVLREMEEYARDIDFPIVGPLVGRLLFQLTTITKAKKILELGSGFGYSAFWFSLASGGRGHITLIDSDRKNKRLCMDYFKRAGLRSQFDFKIGDAIKIIKRTSGQFDIIFNDIDKADYPKTIDLAASHLKRGGLFVTDNLLADGRVYGKNPDKTAKGVLEFTDTLYKDNRFFTTIMPIRDGVSIAVKL